jgi:hypothetical protein
MTAVVGDNDSCAANVLNPLMGVLTRLFINALYLVSSHGHSPILKTGLDLSARAECNAEAVTQQLARSPEGLRGQFGAASRKLAVLPESSASVEHGSWLARVN